MLLHPGHTKGLPNSSAKVLGKYVVFNIFLLFLQHNERMCCITDTTFLALEVV